VPIGRPDERAHYSVDGDTFLDDYEDQENREGADSPQQSVVADAIPTLVIGTNPAPVPGRLFKTREPRPDGDLACAKFH
jgi:hypothetical protein